MTKEGIDQQKYCIECCSWVRLSDVDGGIGICDSLPSDHNQHLVGYHHPGCEHFLPNNKEGIDDGSL